MAAMSHGRSLEREAYERLIIRLPEGCRDKLDHVARELNEADGERARLGYDRW